MSASLSTSASPTPTSGPPGSAAPITGFALDVPGHERLIHTMLAGAGDIDFALLVALAADDGPRCPPDRRAPGDPRPARPRPGRRRPHQGRPRRPGAPPPPSPPRSPPLLAPVHRPPSPPGDRRPRIVPLGDPLAPPAPPASPSWSLDAPVAPRRRPRPRSHPPRRVGPAAPRGPPFLVRPPPARSPPPRSRLRPSLDRRDPDPGLGADRRPHLRPRRSLRRRLSMGSQDRRRHPAAPHA